MMCTLIDVDSMKFLDNFSIDASFQHRQPFLDTRVKQISVNEPNEYQAIFSCTIKQFFHKNFLLYSYRHHCPTQCILTLREKYFGRGQLIQLTNRRRSVTSRSRGTDRGPWKSSSMHYEPNPFMPTVPTFGCPP